MEIEDALKARMRELASKGGFARWKEVAKKKRSEIMRKVAAARKPKKSRT